MKLSFVSLIFVLVSCAELGVQTETTEQAIVPDAPMLLDAPTLAEYKAALPPVSWKKLQDIFDSPSTLWFDKDVMIPSYQDSVGDGSFTPIGARANNAGAGVIVPQGRRLFTDDGEHWSFPFGQTAGLDDTPNKHVINFLSLPYQPDGSYLPIVYRTIDDNSALGGLGLHQWQWWYPKGTVAGEIIYVRDGAGDLYAVEVRTRSRYLEGWAVNAFRPFPTAESLASAIKAERTDWSTNANLSALVAHLEDPETLVPDSLSSPDFNNIFSESGFIDPIPSIDDDGLVRSLLSNTPFVSSYGHAWKSNGSDQAFAATTNDTFSVVPAQNMSGLLEVRETSCVRCHEDAGKSINDFEPDAILYGDIWGSDRIFSFHPWNQDRYVTFNTENREVRPEFADADYVVRYDSSQHTAEHYQELPRP